MNDRERRRKKRKNKKHKQSRLKPLEIDASVNLYDYYKDKIRQGLHTDINLQGFEFGFDIVEFMSDIDATLDHFKVDLEKRSLTGNVLIRFGLMYSLQNRKIWIPADNPVLNYIADLWEHHNRLVKAKN